MRTTDSLTATPPATLVSPELGLASCALTMPDGPHRQVAQNPDGCEKGPQVKAVVDEDCPAGQDSALTRFVCGALVNALRRADHGA